MYSQVIMVLLHGYLEQLPGYLQWDPNSGDTYITSRDTYTRYLDTYNGTPIVEIHKSPQGTPTPGIWIPTVGPQ